MPLFQYETGSTDVESRIARLEDNYKFLQGLVSGWAGIGTEPYFSVLRAREAFFDLMPFEFFHIQNNVSQEIQSGISLFSEFNALGSNLAGVQWSSASGASSVLSIGPTLAGSRVLLGGIAIFSSNSSGRRTVSLNFYNNSSILQFGITPLSIASASGTEVTAGSFFAVSNIRRNSSVKQLKVEITQDSGSTITLTFLDCFGMRLS